MFGGAIEKAVSGCYQDFNLEDLVGQVVYIFLG
jgi:hypothetical protein